MTKDKTRPTKDATPHRYRDKLLPAGAVGVPEPLAKANEELRITGLAAEKAVTQRKEAEAAAKAAPRLDSAAGVEAVRRGEDPPKETAPAREKDAETARQRERAAKTIAERASVALERATREHRDEWLTPQREDMETRTQDAFDAVDALAEALDRLGVSAGIVATLQTEPQGKVIEGARFFKPRPVGPPRMLAELREWISRTPPDELPSELTPEQEELKRTQRGMQQLARGGVFVGFD